MLSSLLSPAQMAAFITALSRPGAWAAPRFIPELSTAGVPLFVNPHTELVAWLLRLVPRVFADPGIAKLIGEAVFAAIAADFSGITELAEHE